MNTLHSAPSAASPSLPTQFCSPHRCCGKEQPAPVLLALSGGADSRLLLHLLAQEALCLGYPLHLAHVHHGIRADEADRDAQFCRALAEQYHLPFHLLHADVPGIAAQTGESEEMVGRRVRYEYFARLMEQHSLALLATAHHADDNLETVLLRLSAGSTATGLSGIAPSRPFGGGYLVRPLLQMTRREIVELCALWQLAFVTDSTNADTSLPRNHIRTHVVPPLEQLSPHPQRQWLRSCTFLREDDAYLFSLANELARSARISIGKWHRPSLVTAPLPLLRRALLSFVREIAPDARLQSCHIEALCHLISVGRGRTTLPGGLCASLEGDLLCLSPAEEAAPLPSPFHLPLTQGETALGNTGFYACLSRRDELTCADLSARKNAENPQNVYTPFIHDTLTFDTISNDAYFRLRRDGDLLLMGGMHRKVRKLQNAAHVPPSLRERLPLLCDGQGVLWVPFVGVRDGFALRADGEFILTLRGDPAGRPLPPTEDFEENEV